MRMGRMKRRRRRRGCEQVCSVLRCADADCARPGASFRAALKGRSREVGTNFNPESLSPTENHDAAAGTQRAEIKT